MGASAASSLWDAERAHPESPPQQRPVAQEGFGSAEPLGQPVLCEQSWPGQGRGDTSLLSPAFTAPLLSDKIPWEMHPAMGTLFLHLWAGIQEADMCEYCSTVLIPTIQICWRFHLKFKKIQPHKPQKTHLW